ncbi:MAG: hypothetical protein K8T10_11715 [Candidatus Eremiobacteraeota bacterium]|nr:hypothetical protein [Candidatus Eremiobacteraeota bacterium]
MKIIYSFKGNDEPTLKEVGGKGLSLIKMARHGLPVPDGFVLTVEYFKPWLEELRKHPQWENFINAQEEELATKSRELKNICSSLELNEFQKKALKDYLEILEEKGKGRLFAVRSSSPQEDLEGASFAGGYETVLGVTPETIEDAIRTTFASCLDQRVFIYKREHGFSVDDPRIAVIVQEQVASDVAGVGFTLNPLNNCYDEAVINANWGQGESVVSGMASPDQYIVDKVKMVILNKTIGKKETSVWLTPGGGTVERPDSRHSTLTLSDKQVVELTGVLNEIEEYYGKPMDTEWAFSGGHLYMLQARPITTHIPLPPEIITPPGKRKRLYMDMTLCIQGIRDPLSVMGLSWLHLFLKDFTIEVFGVDLTSDIESGLLYNTGGRSYINYSNMFLLANKESLARGIERMDSLASNIIKGVDEEEYKTMKCPDKLKNVSLKVLTHIPDTIARVFEAAVLPEQLTSFFQRGIDKHIAEMKVAAASDLPIMELTKTATSKTSHMIIHIILPTLLSAQLAESKIKTIFEDDPPEIKGQLDYLDRSLKGNVTVEMGLALYHLSQLLEPEEYKSIDELVDKIEHRDMPGNFMHAWDESMEKYGFRGAKELDIASPRYVDNPKFIIEQMANLVGVKDPENNPQAIYEKSQMERHKAFEILAEAAHKKGWLKSKEFHMLYRLIESFGGYRETHKYFLIMLNHILREHILKEAEKLVKQGRLDNKEQVFDLTIEQVDEGIKDPSMDLRAIGEKNTEFYKELKHVKSFPHLIDSRGKILRAPKRETKEGELQGQAISSGVVRGPVKVLHTPDEKPVLPGDVLVARATDPGWTPLFINAVAIVLEVGGMLQHGSLVAREYGKPCVVGIENVTNLLKDGQIVEVDGSAGIVRIIDEKSAL